MPNYLSSHWFLPAESGPGAEIPVTVLPSPLGVRFEWKIRLYDLNGSEINTDYDGYSDFGFTNEIAHAFARSLTFYLNGIDECNFSVYLDDPMALNIRPLETVVKVWRTIYDSNGDVIYADTAGTPTFAGIVASSIKDGDGNQMQVKVYNPMWRLQFRFHILNHYLETNPDTDLLYTQSELIWKLIDLINNAFGIGVSGTGIQKGIFGWIDDPQVAPYFVGKGSNTWSNIFDDIMDRAAGVDILPEYVHIADDPTLMFFNTDQKRGIDQSSYIFFNYHTGFNDILDNLSEEIVTTPGEFANYVWAVGQGGPNSGRVALALDNSGNTYSYDTVGIYMKIDDNSGIKKISALQPIADASLAQARYPKIAYNVTVSPAAGLYYGFGMDYNIGDVVALNANKGALLVEGIPQRIYQCTLSISENNVEVANPLIANDFYGKVAGT